MNTNSNSNDATSSSSWGPIGPLLTANTPRKELDMTANNCWCGSPRASWKNDRCSGSPYHDPDAASRTDPENVLAVYIAGPMSGILDNNYPAFFEAARDLQEQGGYYVVNPADFGSPAGRVGYTHLLREDLRQMLDCQGVCVLPGWAHSVGARNEVLVAGVLGMPVMSLEEWLRV